MHCCWRSAVCDVMNLHTIFQCWVCNILFSNEFPPILIFQKHIQQCMKHFLEFYKIWLPRTELYQQHFYCGFQSSWKFCFGCIVHQQINNTSDIFVTYQLHLYCNRCIFWKNIFEGFFFITFVLLFVIIFIVILIIIFLFSNVTFL